MKTKKILALPSSARKGGNTDLLCDEFIRGAEAAGHSVEKMYVSFIQIKGCIGCCSCQGNGGRCVQKDDMTAVYEKMQSADVIVFASPVYFYSFNAQMKTLMDRTFAIEQLDRTKLATTSTESSTDVVAEGKQTIDDISPFVIDKFTLSLRAKQIEPRSKTAAGLSFYLCTRTSNRIAL